MPTCPECTHHVFDETSGIHACPQCHTRINLSRGSVTVPPSRRHKFQHASKAGIRAQRNRLVLSDGKVACACCGRTHRLQDSVDGRIDTDGTMKVRVQEGWTLTVTGDFEPHFNERTIPRAVRGQICPTCQGAYPVRAMGRMLVDERPLKVRTVSWNTREQTTAADTADKLLAAAADCEHAAVRDVFTEQANELTHWAHSGDPSWILGRLQVSVFQGRDGRLIRKSTRSAHPIMCECFECMHAERETVGPIAQLDAMILRGPGALTGDKRRYGSE